MQRDASLIAWLKSISKTCIVGLAMRCGRVHPGQLFEWLLSRGGLSDA